MADAALNSASAIQDSTSELMQRLADAGCSTTQRTLQRDLQRLSSVYSLLCDERDKPFGWSWDKHANVHEVPGIDSDTALAFYLACSMWDYPDIRLLLLHRMTAAKVMDIPCATPDGFNLDDYIASVELDFEVGDAIDLKARISQNMAKTYA